MSVRWQYFENFKPQFMERTDPEGKGDCAIWLEDMDEKNWKVFESDIGIDEEYIDFTILVPKTPISNSKRKIVRFDRYEEFNKAKQLAESILQNDSLDSAITIHMGGMDIGIVVEVNCDTRDSIREIQRGARRPEDFTGRDLRQ